jgi:hypothetical protein
MHCPGRWWWMLTLNCPPNIRIEVLRSRRTGLVLKCAAIFCAVALIYSYATYFHLYMTSADRALVDRITIELKSKGESNLTDATGYQSLCVVGPYGLSRKLKQHFTDEQFEKLSFRLNSWFNSGEMDMWLIAVRSPSEFVLFRMNSTLRPRFSGGEVYFGKAIKTHPSVRYFARGSIHFF